VLAAAGPGGSERAAGLLGGEQRDVEWEGEEEEAELVPEVDDPDLLNLVSMCVCV
jgi:hypothetical protein